MTTHVSPAEVVGAAPRPIAAFWTIPLVLGVVSIGTGLLVLAWPGKTLLVVAVLFGVQLLVAGALRLLGALLRPGGAAARVADLVLGMVLVAVGVLCLRDLTRTLAVLVLLLGLAWLLGGILELAGALAEGLPRQWTPATVAGVLTGVLSIAGGVVVLAYPGISLATLAVVLGIFLVLHGAAAIAQAFQLRRGLP